MPGSLADAPRVRPASAYISFLAFGSFWGAWGASLPGLKEQAHVSDGRLGAALLFVGAGALPAMLLIGRAVDRWGARTGALLLSGLGLSGVVVALGARGSVSLALCLLLVGAASGAADVAMNSAAGSAQAAAAKPVITRAHGCFSLAVVVVSLLTGALRWFGGGLVVPFLLVAAASCTAAVALWLDARRSRSGPLTKLWSDRTGAPVKTLDAEQPAGRARTRRDAYRTLLGVGLLGALAFAVENAHQSWGAVFLGDTLDAPAGLTAAAPATFAAVAAAARFTAGWTGRVPPLRLLSGGGIVVITGTLTVAAAPTAAVALIGLALAAAGTAVLFPTLLSLATAGVDESRRGRATSTVSTTAYLGFLLGPVFVGTLAGRASLRWAFVGVAALGLVFVLGAPSVAARAQARLAADAPSVTRAASSDR